MGNASWTYEVPAFGADSVGLEEYIVEEASGEPVGKVVTVLDRRGDLYVAVERGAPPLTHDLRAVRWDDIERVDHSGLTVRLSLSQEALGEALELDPKRRVEAESAEAVRLTELPPEVRPTAATPETPGPIERPTLLLSIGWFALSLLALLALFIAELEVDFTWHFALLVIPALLLLFSLVSAYQFFRRPYERIERPEE